MLRAAAVMGCVGIALIASESGAGLPELGIRGLLDTEQPAATTCIDDTSHDHDWSNDMLCTRPDGTRFRTSYDGAKRFAER